MYKLDNDLKEYSKELEIMVEKMVESKPDTNFDENFKIRLKNELQAKISELSEQAEPKKQKKTNTFAYLFATLKYSGVFAVILITIIIIPLFYNQPSVQIQNDSGVQLQQTEIKTNQEETPAIKKDEGSVIDAKDLLDGIPVKKPTQDTKSLPKKNILPQKSSTTSSSSSSSSSTSLSGGAYIPSGDENDGLDCTKGCGGGGGIGGEGGSDDAIYGPDGKAPGGGGGDPEPASSTMIAPISEPKTDLGYGYKKDSKNVYYKENIIQGADPVSFTILNTNYSKDKNNVYHQGVLIKNAHPASFQVIDVYNAKDKNNEYYKGEIK